MTWLTFVIDAVACYRLTRLVVVDSITEEIRDWAVRWVKMHELLTCRYCVGIWVGAGVAAARWTIPTAWNVAAWALAIAAFAPILARLEPPKT